MCYSINVRHIDLFSGIGGFSLAVEAVWPNSEHIFCEIDPYCQALLKKRFEGSVIYGDIRTLSRERLIADTDIRESRPRDESKSGIKKFEEFSTNDTIILTGGFPCQPFSQAGKRRGTKDNRYLWPEMLRVIRDFKPTWVIAENVRGLLTIEQGMVFEQVCLDLEREGYEVQPFIIPAVAVNAPHRRDRVWFVANRNDIEQERSKPEGSRSGQSKTEIRNRDSNAPDTRQKLWGEGEQKQKQFRNKETSNNCERYGRSQWDENWLEVATSLCGVDDGLPARVDRLELSKSRHRIERLKGLGNSIVPQVAIEIFKAIMSVEVKRNI